MPLADDIELLRRPIGFAVGVNRAPGLDVAVQRERLLGLLHFVRTFASEVLEKEFATTIEGYPQPALKKTRELRQSLRGEGTHDRARQFLSALIDLIEAEVDYEDSSPEDDPEQKEQAEDAVLMLIGRLLERFAAWAHELGHLPAVATEADRGVAEWRKLAKRLER
jgi:hypothetical protein